MSASPTPQDSSPYLVTFAGKTRLIEAPDLGTLKKFVLDGEQFSAKRASGPEVMAFFKGGGKVETVVENKT